MVLNKNKTEMNTWVLYPFGRRQVTLKISSFKMPLTLSLLHSCIVYTLLVYICVSVFVCFEYICHAYAMMSFRISEHHNSLPQCPIVKQRDIPLMLVRFFPPMLSCYLLTGAESGKEISSAYNSWSINSLLLLLYIFWRPPFFGSFLLSALDFA